MSFIPDIQNRILHADAAPEHTHVGIITSIQDGVAYAEGLTKVGFNEIVIIEHPTKQITAVAFNLEKERTGLLVLDDYSDISEGLSVRSTGEILSVKVDSNILSRVVNPLGVSLDGLQYVPGLAAKAMPLERIASGVMTRYPVTRPLQTGILVVDALVNVGLGQRELIIGDRQTGKTTLAIDTILNQKGKDILCVYVSIGQKQSRVKQIIRRLTDSGAMNYTTVVTASAADPVSLQYLAPYAGVSIAEFFLDQGKDVLVVYDDLTKHAWAYRQLSLLFRRPPGREAYPGDVFYLHSRLLERSAQLSADFGGGSITALPIIETQAGDVSAYIPTNVISITDGQIYLESELFNSGIRPAVNPGLSVTRVGGAAQPKNLKKVAGSLKLELAQYRELAAFSKFGGDLDKQTQAKLTRGEAITQLLVQPPTNPYSLAEETVLVWSANKGYLDELGTSNIAKWVAGLTEFLNSHHAELVKTLNKGTWGDEAEAGIKTAVDEYLYSLENAKAA